MPTQALNQTATVLGQVNPSTLTASQQQAVSGTLAQMQQTLQSMSASLTSTSTAARDDVNATKQDINKATTTLTQPDNTKLDELQERSDRLFSQQQDWLNQRRAEETARIQREFDELREGTEKAQGREFAGRATGLVTQAGGHLGLTQSHAGNLQLLRETHRGEIQALEGKRQTAIRQAQAAFDERQFELAREQIKFAMDMEKEIYNREQQFFDNQLKLQSEMRKQMEFDRETAKEQLDMIVKTNMPVTSEQATRIGEALGISSEMALKVIEVSREAAKAESDKAKLEALKKMYELMRTAPAGTEISMPDGTVLTAVGAAGDISLTTIKATDGLYYQVARNKLTGEQTITSTGIRGSVAGAGTSGFNLSNTGKGQLLAAGLSEAEINDIERLVKNVGFENAEKVLKEDGYEDDQITAVKSALSASSGINLMLGNLGADLEKIMEEYDPTQ